MVAKLSEKRGAVSVDSLDLAQDRSDVRLEQAQFAD